MRRLILLCLITTASIYANSQNTSTITITSEQLRTTNLIFAEHNKLSKTVPLLKQRINNLELINKKWENTDSLRKVQAVQYENIIKDKDKSIRRLNESLKRTKTLIKVGAGSCVLVFLCLLLK